MKTVLTALIRVYAYIISPLTGASCRFHPTCSGYAVQVVQRHGALKGLALAIRRISKCHPWHKGEYLDPVPAAVDWSAIIGYKRSTSKHSQNQPE